MLDINNLPSLDTSGGSLLQAKTYLPLSPNDNVQLPCLKWTLGKIAFAYIKKQRGCLEHAKYIDLNHNLVLVLGLCLLDEVLSDSLHSGKEELNHGVLFLKNGTFCSSEW